MDLKDGMFIICDDVNISPDIETTLKQAMTNFQDDTVHFTVNTDREGKKLIIPKRAMINLTSVDSQGGNELQNRQMSYTVDESRQQDEAVFDMQNDKAMTGENPELKNTEELLICQAMFDIWATNIITVVIPFADKIIWNNKENRRNYDMFLDIIKGFTMCNFMKRKKNDKGYYVATLDDYYAAETLYNKVSKTMGMKLTEAEIKMAKVLATKFGSKGATSKDIQEAMGLSRTIVEKRLKILEEKIPQMYSEKCNEGTSTEDGAGNRSSYSRYITNYYLPAFNGNAYGKVVSLNPEALF